jgi:hypothetical protein
MKKQPMQSQSFYMHLVDTGEIEVLIDNAGIDQQRKHDLMMILHSHIHTVVIDVVLSSLDEHDKKLFLVHLHESDAESIWSFLSARIIAAEAKISHAISSLIEEKMKDLLALPKV